MPGPESLEILTEASTSPHEEIRLTAAATLWRYGPSADDLAPALLLDPDQGVRRFALRSQARRIRAHPGTPLPARTRDAIDLVTARAAPALRLLAASVAARLEDEEPTSAEVSGLLQSPLLSRDVADVIGPQGSGPLLELIRSADAGIAGDATDVASEIEGDPAALLTAAAQHPDASVRIHAGQALARTGPPELVLLLLDDDEAAVRHQALAAVPRLPASRELSAKLAQLSAQDPAESVRTRAQRATSPPAENGL
ncbi:hypothetical protein AGRA3207_007435 [Actinomadura graeca]|uniref:HEAT repeat domain-containing protein n=1 Tax=Actinomadura graeca TaxID=2750812 RepID=A0ABX8R5R3_9ACTN|nr:hypothetical protein [Actinomadura graeca]QXJ25871.1 hypothetical protein AGRA3207_007435 [Actinomadura graeca]